MTDPHRIKGLPVDLIDGALDSFCAFASGKRLSGEMTWILPVHYISTDDLDPHQGEDVALKLETFPVRRSEEPPLGCPA